MDCHNPGDSEGRGSGVRESVKVCGHDPRLGVYLHCAEAFTALGHVQSGSSVLGTPEIPEVMAICSLLLERES